MVKEYFIIMIKVDMKVNMLMEKKKVKENILLKMVIFMKVILKKIKEKEKAFLNLVEGINMKVIF